MRKIFIKEEKEGMYLVKNDSIIRKLGNNLIFVYVHIYKYK